MEIIRGLYDVTERNYRNVKIEKKKFSVSLYDFVYFFRVCRRAVLAWGLVVSVFPYL